MEPAEPNLKVTDRRHFTAEGDLKADAQPTPEGENLQEPSLLPSAESERMTDRPADPFRDSKADTDHGPVSFSNFIISLATQAAGYLGGEQRDLGAARQVISAIEMLKDKSEGRRTDDETKIIEAVLFDLRMAFVGSAKGQNS